MKMTKILALFLALALLLPCFTVFTAYGADGATGEEAVASDAEIMKVFGGAKAIVSMTYDDGQYETAAWMTEMFAKYNLRASCMLITKNFATHPQLVEKWQALLDQGYLSAENHSMTHAVLPGTEWSNYEQYKQNNTPENYQYELLDSKILLEEKFGKPIITFAASNNTLWTEATDIVKANYYAMRKGARGVQTIPPVEGSDDAGGWYHLYMRGIDNSTLDENKAYVQQCIDRNAWFVSMTHAVINDSDDPTKPERYEAFYAWLAERQDAGDVWVTTFADATRYVREYQNSTVKAYSKAGEVLVDLDMNAMTGDGLPLVPEIFNHPLTVKVEVPKEWKHVSYTLTETVEYASTFTEGGKTYAYVNAVPNTEVSVKGASFYNSSVAPTLAGYVTSGAGFTSGDMQVSARSDRFVAGANVKVFAKLNLADFTESTSAILPIVTNKSLGATLDVYGVSDPNLAKNWSGDTLNAYNAPANDVFGTVTDGATLVTSVDILDADTYLVDVSAYVEEMKALDAEYATVIIALSPASAADSVEFSFGTAEDVPEGDASAGPFVPYTFTEDFENSGSKGGFATGGIGTNESNSFEVAECEDRFGNTTKMIEWKTTRTYERNFLGGVINSANTITEADLGATYRVSFWFKAEGTGQFAVWLGNGKTKTLHTYMPKDKVTTFEITEENVGKWIKYNVSFTLDESNLAVDANKGGQNVYFAISPKAFKQEPEAPVMLYLDDVVSTKVNTGAKSAMIPEDSAALSADGISVGGNVDSYENIRKAYASFTSLDFEYSHAAYLTLRVFESYGQTVKIYGLPTASISPDMTYENAPANVLAEGIDESLAYHGIPIFEGVLEVGEAVLDVSDFVKSAGGECVFVIVTEDITERELLYYDFELVTAHVGSDVTSDGAVTTNEGALIVGGSYVTFDKAFRAAEDGKTYLLTVEADEGVAVSVGDESYTVSSDGTLSFEFDYSKEMSGITLAKDGGFTVNSLRLVTKSASVVLSAESTLELEMPAYSDMPKIDVYTALEIGKTLILDVYVVYSDALTSLTFDGEEYGLFDLLEKGTEWFGDLEVYAFEKELTPISAADATELVLKVDCGERTVPVSYRLSAVTYADALLDEAEYEEEKTLVLDLLAYLEALYIYAEKDADAISAILEENLYEGGTASDERALTPDAAVVSSITADVSDGTLSLAVALADGIQAQTANFRIGAAIALEAVEEDGAFKVKIPINVANSVITVTASDADGNAVSTSFDLFSLVTPESEDALSALVNSGVIYAVSAQEYLK